MIPPTQWKVALDIQFALDSGNGWSLNTPDGAGVGRYQGIGMLTIRSSGTRL